MRAIAATSLGLIAAACLSAPLIAPHAPDAIDMANRLAAPSDDHPLGTDHLGRDLLSRLVWGGRSTILLALVTTVATLAVGLVMGAVSGYFGGLADDAIEGFVLLFQGLPGLSFMLAIAGTLGPGATSILIAVVITSWADFSRVVRAETLRLREAQWVETLRSLGAGHGRIIALHIVPNLIGPVVVLFTLRLGRIILAIAALSFLGLGLQPPAAEWGVMISDARAYHRAAPLVMIAPGLCIVAVVLCVNLLGDDLRDRLDARLERPALP